MLLFVKHSDRPVISILKTWAQRQGRDNAAALNLFKSDALRVEVSFGSSFAVHLAGITKLFFVIVSEESFLHVTSCISTYSFYYCWPTSSIEWICSDFGKGISQEWIIYQQCCNHGGIIFNKHSILCRIIFIVMVFNFVRTFEYFAINLLCSEISDPSMSHFL